MKEKPKVLVFTASAKRPLFLRHCILQMQQQSYPVHHVVYINSTDYTGPDDTHNYLKLLNDIVIQPGNKLDAAYGPTASHHRNHMAAIQLIDWEAYDLFFKVDDDDIYRSQYIEDAVAHFQEHRWDFSGEISQGHIQMDSWHENNSIVQFDNDLKLKNAAFMPSSFAFSKHAMKHILAIDNIHGSEDKVWHEELAGSNKFKTVVRPSGNFIYNIHGSNVCRPKPKR